MTYTGTITTSSSQVSPDPLITSALQASQTIKANFSTSGVLADQCNLNYITQLPISYNNPLTINLTNLPDRFNVMGNFVRVRSITLFNTASTDGWDLTMTPSASNGWTAFMNTGAIFQIPPSSVLSQGGMAIFCPNTTGFVVTGTNCQLTFNNLNAASVPNPINLNIEINGCNA